MVPWCFRKPVNSRMVTTFDTKCFYSRISVDKNYNRLGNFTFTKVSINRPLAKKLKRHILEKILEQRLNWKSLLLINLQSFIVFSILLLKVCFRKKYCSVHGRASKIGLPFYRSMQDWSLYTDPSFAYKPHSYIYFIIAIKKIVHSKTNK